MIEATGATRRTVATTDGGQVFLCRTKFRCGRGRHDSVALPRRVGRQNVAKKDLTSFLIRPVVCTNRAPAAVAPTLRALAQTGVRGEDALLVLSGLHPTA